MCQFKSLNMLQLRDMFLLICFRHNRYNYDPNYTTGESSVDDFIDDGESSEEETRRRKRFRQKVVYLSVPFSYKFNDIIFDLANVVL